MRVMNSGNKKHLGQTGFLTHFPTSRSLGVRTEDGVPNVGASWLAIVGCSAALLLYLAPSAVSSFPLILAHSRSACCQRIFSRILALRCSKCHLELSRYVKAISISSRTSFPGNFGRPSCWGPGGGPGGMFGGWMGSGSLSNQAMILSHFLLVRNLD
ncbi:hypothetical protein EV426DRAFT_669806, partial [Tirmania nivea]